MIDLRNIENVYLLGIGGIGMSALARYFRFIGKKVSGYDKTPSALTRELENENIPVHYQSDLSLLPAIDQLDNTLVIYTPAVPADFEELLYLQRNKYHIFKRSQILGLLTADKRCVAIAGTHGKTSVTTMTAHLIHESAVDCQAFMGGISKNYHSNLLLPSHPSEVIVVEADEFDRSFLQLHPDLAVITWMDADHLDIYGDHKSVINAFTDFIRQIVDGGSLIYKSDLMIDRSWNNRINYYTYSITGEADFQATNLQIIDGAYQFDLKTPFGIFGSLRLNYPGLMNVENSVAATALALLSGATEEEIRKALPTYQGVVRRFDVQFRGKEVLYIDDYAHHPRELEATIRSVRSLYPEKKITGIFQPHLYTRTRDFAAEFAEALDLLDQAFVLEIYPARELPIEGVDCASILDKMSLNKKIRCKTSQFPELLGQMTGDILLTLGAGDIDRLIEPIVHYLQKNEKR